MKILHVFGGLSTGGAETLIVNILKENNNPDVSFDFVIHHPQLDDYINLVKQYGCNVYICPSYKFINNAKYKKWWKTFFEEHKYDIVHGHTTSTALIYLRIAKGYCYKTISHSHSDSYGAGPVALLKTLMSKNIYKYSDLYLGCSKAANDFLYGKHSENAIVFKSAFNIQDFKFDKSARESIRKDLMIDSNTFVIGTVGRMSYLKNPYFILEIINRLKEQINVPFRFLWVGDGEEREKIKKSISKYSLNKFFIFVGSTLNPSPYYSAMDMFLLPSKKEGLGIALLEAQANGLKCLVSKSIHDEAIVTLLVRKLPLDKGVDVWVSNILKDKDLSYNRTIYFDKVEKSGYDIKDATKQLLDLYKELVVNENK